MAELKFVFDGALAEALQDEIEALVLEKLAEVDQGAVAFYNPGGYNVGDLVWVNNDRAGIIVKIDADDDVLPYLVNIIKSGANIWCDVDDISRRTNDAEP